MISLTLKNRVVIVGLSSLMILSGFSEASMDDPKAGPSLHELMKEATFVFIGTVQETNASTVKTLPVDDRTAIVVVDDVLHSPEALSKYAGTKITVQLNAKLPPLKVKDRVVFYTSSLQLGETLAVREIGRSDVKKTVAEHKEEVAAAHLEVRLLARLKIADLVVTGKVTEVREPKIVVEKPIDFDDPKWREAVVQVDKVEHGKLEAKTTVVRFPTSNDVRWHDSPKFKVGDEGTFLLKQREFPRMETKTGYVSLNPMDFQPKTVTPKIQALIKANLALPK